MGEIQAVLLFVDTPTVPSPPQTVYQTGTAVHTLNTSCTLFDFIVLIAFSCIVLSCMVLNIVCNLLLNFILFYFIVLVVFSFLVLSCLVLHP